MAKRKKELRIKHIDGKYLIVRGDDVLKSFSRVELLRAYLSDSVGELKRPKEYSKISVRCIETGELFRSISDAAKHTGVKDYLIRNDVNPIKKPPKNGERLTFARLNTYELKSLKPSDFV